MAIQLGGKEFTQEQIIAAIAASNDPAPTVKSYTSIDEVSGILQSVLVRLDALEDRLPITRAGFGVTTTSDSNSTTNRVQMLDRDGRTIIVTYKTPTT